MKRQLWLLLLLVITGALVGCNLPSTPTCTPGELVAPALSSPAMWAVVGSLTPTLSWASTASSAPYPYESCFPSGYRVTLQRYVPPSPTELGGPTYGPGIRSYTPLTPLEPATQYRWGVAARGAGGDGPYAGDRYFFTGPICATGALVAPNLSDPNNGTMVNTLQPLLSWDYPEACIPEGYRIDLSTESAFADTSLSGGTGNPSTRWLPGTDLMDCTWYYWRVAPINGTTLGPFSITRNFMVNVSGACLYPLPELLIPVEPLVTVPPVLLVPEFTLDSNANCRYGPSQLYEVRTSYFAGQVLPIDGRNEDGSWLYTANDDCFISIVLGKFNGDPNLLPFRDAPPPPEPPDEPPDEGPTYNGCQDYPTQDLCKQDPAGFGCFWGQNNSCVSSKP